MLASSNSSLELRLVDISKRFGSVVALEQTSLSVNPGSLVALLGPSGCGKTTTLRIVAGFEVPDSGLIWIGNREVSSIPPNRRRIGMVFQNYSLFPHMTVAENVEFGLKMTGVAKEDITRRVSSILDLMRLPNHADRFPHQLSGGQQQRVALARSLVTNPTVLLLDEPLGALDKSLRESMQFELRRIQQKLAITTILVTHDQEEALTLSDRIAVMNSGRILQVGTPSEIYNAPRTRFVSEFLGTANLFEGRAEKMADTLSVSIQLANEQPLIITSSRTPTGALSDQVTLAIRPESINISRQCPSAANVMSATVIDSVFRGTYLVYEIRIPGRPAPVIAYVQPRSHSGGGMFLAGEQVFLSFSPNDVAILEKD